jgi:outer membrane receptor for ferrienterochelin and colicin
MVHMLAKHLISSLGLVLLITLVASAQVPTTGRLTGTVTDQQGGVIPKAAILAKNVQTGAEFRAIANGIGVWEMPSVPTGKYTISATAPGFRTTPIKEITVDMAAAVTVDATLQVGLADTVLVTASKHEEEVINAPATVSVISEQMIQALPSQNLADLLRAVPGMNVARTSAREFNVTSRSASGVMPSAQLALLDGRALYDGFTGYITWDALPVNLDEVKQVEVIRGPASAVWGANAMNGVVNIITKPPREMLGTSFTLGIGTFDRSGGSPDSDSGSLYYVSATHAQALNDRWSFKITGGAYTQDAFARPQGAMPNQFHTPYPAFTNQGTTLPKVNGRVDYDLPDGKQHLRLEGGCASKEGIGYGGLGPWKLDRGNIESYGKADYVRGALRITGYANISTGATMTNPLFVGPTGRTPELQH